VDVLQGAARGPARPLRPSRSPRDERLAPPRGAHRANSSILPLCSHVESTTSWLVPDTRRGRLPAPHHVREHDRAQCLDVDARRLGISTTRAYIRAQRCRGLRRPIFGGSPTPHHLPALRCRAGPRASYGCWHDSNASPSRCRAREPHTRHASGAGRWTIRPALEKRLQADMGWLQSEGVTLFTSTRSGRAASAGASAGLLRVLGLARRGDRCCPRARRRRSSWCSPPRPRRPV